MQSIDKFGDCNKENKILLVIHEDLYQSQNDEKSSDDRRTHGFHKTLRNSVIHPYFVERYVWWTVQHFFFSG